MKKAKEITYKKTGNGEAAFQMTSIILAYLSEKIKFIKSPNRFS
jgi:hypothetical protein